MFHKLNRSNHLAAQITALIQSPRVGSDVTDVMMRCVTDVTDVQQGSVSECLEDPQRVRHSGKSG